MMMVCVRRTCLQPQLNKAISGRERLLRADKNLKDWIIFRSRCPRICVCVLHVRRMISTCRLLTRIRPPGETRKGCGGDV